MESKYEPSGLTQHAGYLTEECGEVLAALGKTMRWGLASWNPDVPEEERETNEEWLRREMEDLKGAISRMEDFLDGKRR